jgi:hypothetical protein
MEVKGWSCGSALQKAWELVRKRSLKGMTFRLSPGG